MKIKLLITSILILFTGMFHFCSGQASRFSNDLYSNKGDTLRYRLLSPDYAINRRFPLVIFLHGSGERGNDNEQQLKWGVQNFATDQAMSLHPAFVLAPQCPTTMQWANFSSGSGTTIKLNPTPTKPMALLMELIQQLLKKYPIDTTRIYITGLSMGGFGTFDALARYPDLFAAAVPVCGGGDVATAPLFTHIPIWIAHGAEDPAVNPMLSVDMLLALQKAGAHPGYSQYPEVGHFSWLMAYTDPLLMEWLFRQHK